MACNGWLRLQPGFINTLFVPSSYLLRYFFGICIYHLRVISEQVSNKVRLMYEAGINQVNLLTAYLLTHQHVNFST